MHILIEREDGGVSVMELEDGVNVREEIAKWAEGSGLVAHRWHVIKPSEHLPADRNFRNAWVHVGNGRCEVHMAKARSLHMINIRHSRNTALEALDAPHMRALTRNDTDAATRIEANKQRLRDIPQTIDLEACTTPEELHACWPDGLQRLRWI